MDEQLTACRIADKGPAVIPPSREELRVLPEPLQRAWAVAAILRAHNVDFAAARQRAHCLPSSSPVDYVGQTIEPGMR